MVGVAFMDESSLPEGMFKLPRAGLQNVDAAPRKGDPVVNVVSIAGPYDAKGARGITEPPQDICLSSDRCPRRGRCAKKITHHAGTSRISPACYG